MSLTYLHYEVLRTFRSRALLFSLGFPLVLFLVAASTNRHATLEGVSFPLYYMAGMASWGAMLGIISAGSRISVERQQGWTRQLRLTPLSPRAYLLAKVVCGYLTALLTMVVLFVAGTVLGVRLGVREWAVMVGLALVGLVPFGLFGVMVGHLLKPDSLGPAVGGLSALFALFGGAWGPIATHGTLLDLVRDIPSYWLVQSGTVAYGGGGWPLRGWVVVGIWSLAAARLAFVAYRRDTARVV